MPSPVFVDHAFSCRLESVEAVQLAGLVGAASVRVPSIGAAALSLAGGVAAFVGANASVSRAAGLGMGGPVADADVAALVDFYRSRATPARVLVSPFADESLFARLGEHGFRLAALDTILTRPLDAAEALPAPAPGVAVRLAAREESALWVRTSLAGFGGGSPSASPAPDARAAVFQAAFEASFEEPGISYYVGCVGGALAGAAALHVHRGVAYLFAASTLEAHRARGVQAALILARLASARAAGCDVAFAGTSPGSVSQRNFERLGFSPAYSQARMVRAFA